MNRGNLKFLKELIEAPSPSGFEQPAQRVMRERMAKYADDVQTDVHGNVIAALNPKGSPFGCCSKTILLYLFTSIIPLYISNWNTLYVISKGIV